MGQSKCSDQHKQRHSRLRTASHAEGHRFDPTVGTTTVAPGSQVLKTRVFVLCSDRWPARHRGETKSLPRCNR